MLSQTTGARLREAILADLPRLHREDAHLGSLNISVCTKGGRSGASTLRWIIANKHMNKALLLAREVSPPGSRNLLARGESYAVILNQTVLPAREALHGHGWKGFHELRATYACECYEHLTGHAAPVHGGKGYRIDGNFDQQTRQQISTEIGHFRVNVVSPYIGVRSREIFLDYVCRKWRS